MGKKKLAKEKKPKKRFGRLRETLSGFRMINFVMLLGAGILNAVAVSLLLAPVNLYDNPLPQSDSIIISLRCPLVKIGRAHV